VVRFTIPLDQISIYDSYSGYGLADFCCRTNRNSDFVCLHLRLHRYLHRLDHVRLSAVVTRACYILLASAVVSSMETCCTTTAKDCGVVTCSWILNMTSACTHSRLRLVRLVRLCRRDLL
jgi:hypothetical protein